jgi:predicted nuclease of restriction endonuclease-like (RecB) superfamily
MNEAADQNWNTRALYRQIGTLYYERLLVSQDRQSLREEASANLTALKVTPREFVRDPVMLEFLGIPNTEKLLESRLEDALIENLQSFLLDLKTTELAHQDIGQMDMYVRMYDDLRRSAEDNPTVGIILCAQKDKSIVRYSVLHGNEQRLLKENMLNADDNEEGGQP